MRAAGFTLKPFNWPQERHPVLTGNVIIADGALRIEYHLSGLSGAVAFPSTSANPARRLQLWRHTCFELLWGPLRQPGYWELNAAPAGHWNILSFTGYRRGLREELRVGARVTTCRRPDAFSLFCILPAVALTGNGPYRLAPAAIIIHADGRRTFWAIRHPGEAPDFHHPASFALTA